MNTLKIMILVSTVSFISTPTIYASQSNKALPFLAGASGTAALMFGLTAFILNAPRRAKRAETIEKLSLFMKSLDAMPDNLGVHEAVKRIIGHGTCCERVNLVPITSKETLAQIALILAAMMSGVICFVACVRMSASADAKV